MEERMIRTFDTIMRATGNEEMEVEGYALKFDKVTHIGSRKYGFREKINRTSLEGAKLDNVVFSFNHNLDHVLAGVRNKSLSLTVDDTGLKVWAKIVDTAIGRDVYRLIQENLINRMSFMAVLKETKWTISENDEEPDLREITAFDEFLDVAAVTFPAYEDTPLAARSFESDLAERQREITKRQLEKLNKILRRN